MKTIYTASVTSVGGRTGHVESSDGALKLDLTFPSPDGRPAKLTNPEQLFAAGYAACFSSAMDHIARKRKLETGPITIVNQVTLLTDGADLFQLAVDMDVTVPNLDQAGAEELVAGGHQVCPYSNATRGNVEVKLTAHGGNN
jgi:Ohr subfamily peroxiredoxin